MCFLYLSSAVNNRLHTEHAYVRMLKQTGIWDCTGCCTGGCTIGCTDLTLAGMADCTVFAHAVSTKTGGCRELTLAGMADHTVFASTRTDLLGTSLATLPCNDTPDDLAGFCTFDPQCGHEFFKWLVNCSCEKNDLVHILNLNLFTLLYL